MRRSGRLALALLAPVLLVACGGDSEDPGTTELRKPPMTVPGESTGSTGDESETTTGTDSTGTEAGQGGSGPSATGPMDQPNPGNGGVPAPDGNDPPASEEDSPAHDTPPEPGSPADRFEQFCAQNPGAC